MTASYKDYSDEELIGRLRSGESEIMDYLLEKYKPLVRSRCNMLYLIGGDSEDLLQEGMIGLFKAIRDYSPQKSAGFATFAQLCINRQLYKLMEATGRKKNQPLNNAVSLSNEEGQDGGTLEEYLPGRVADPEQLLLEKEKFLEFYEKLQKNLSRMEERVLTLYLEGYHYMRIAEIMNKSPKSIDNALQRIRSKIRLICGE